MAHQLVFALFLLEAVVVRELLPDFDVLAREENQVRLTVHFQHFGVHAGRAAVVLQQAGAIFRTTLVSHRFLLHMRALLRISDQKTGTRNLQVCGRHGSP